jgi:hypothetical protein
MHQNLMGLTQSRADPSQCSRFCSVVSFIGFASCTILKNVAPGMGGPSGLNRFEEVEMSLGVPSARATIFISDFGFHFCLDPRRARHRVRRLGFGAL